MAQIQKKIRNHTGSIWGSRSADEVMVVSISCLEKPSQSAGILWKSCEPSVFSNEPSCLEFNPEVNSFFRRNQQVF
jgi:hypothetical protein